MTVTDCQRTASW